MTPHFEERIKDAVRRRNGSEVIALIKRQYEFDCPSFVYAGPGHQSRHICAQRSPHDIEDDHSDDMYEWQGTSIVDPVTKKLLVNAEHHGDGRCGH